MELLGVTGVEDSIQVESAMKLFPNPASDELTVEFISTGGEISMSVFNLTGQNVLRVQSLAAGGINSQTINTETLSNGVYILEVQNNGESQRMKFTISR